MDPWQGDCGMTQKWNLIVDLDLCINCHNCVLATKDEYVGNDFPGYSAAQPSPGLDTIRIDKHIRGSGSHAEITYVPTMCNHCDDAPCMKADTRNAIRKRDDGIVLIDPVAGKGAVDLPAACPFGMILWDDEAQMPHIWNFDAHLLDAGWKEPRATQACPTGALKALKLSDDAMANLTASEALSHLPAGTLAKPRVHYRNAGRLHTHLIAGAIVRGQAGRVECAAGLQVDLLVDGAVSAVEHSDAFGDFQFRNVPATAGDIVLRVREGGEVIHSITVDTGASAIVEIAID
jgi:Fe-S-cluster-containing dehydrogenase component